MKNKKFEALISRAYGASSEFEKIKYQINRAREIMLRHDAFNRLNVELQLDQCVTICLIASHTSRRDLTRVRMFGSSTVEVFEFSLLEGYADN